MPETVLSAGRLQEGEKEEKMIKAVILVLLMLASYVFVFMAGVSYAAYREARIRNKVLKSIDVEGVKTEEDYLICKGMLTALEMLRNEEDSDLKHSKKQNSACNSAESVV